MQVKIIGAGLAGCEASYQLAKRGIKVKLYEMRPVKMTEAHQTSNFAELVCSNSFRATDITNAVGLLKYEMEELDSLIIRAAKSTSVSAGGSLAVDRELFSNYIMNVIKNHENIEIINEEVTKINEEELTIVAAGPLVSNNLFTEIERIVGSQELHFFDAVAPIILKESINMDVCYLKNRYDKGEASYINCPMTKEEYDKFYYELINARKVQPKGFENNVFEGCMPVEVMAERGIQTLTFGPLKPVGLEKPDGSKPYAVVQLREDDAKNTMYNMVGFQTSLAWSEQKRVIGLIPGLDKAEIVRYGVIHKNSYIESPNILNSSYQVIKNPKIFFAGQISGVEGYVESAASGLTTAIQIFSLLKYEETKPFSDDTMLGALSKYISTKNKSFVPMHANYGIISELDFKHKKKERKELYAKRSLESMKKFKENNHGLFTKI